MAEGKEIGFSWHANGVCVNIVPGYRPVYVTVKNPAPNKNFWITVTSNSGR